VAVRYVKLPVVRGNAISSTKAHDGTLVMVPLIVDTWLRFDQILEIAPSDKAGASVVYLVGREPPLHVKLTSDEIWRRYAEDYREVCS
jgi:hypothetical protein